MSKKKSCFVIMPISDQAGYEKGHFAKVFEDIIEPTVTGLGYDTILASKVASTNLIHADIITRLLTADLAICDLSANNPNVMFELGIRQAFDKPVVLIKDDVTANPFDISIIRYQEYDSKLSFRGVNAARSLISSAIQATVGSKGSDINSIVKLLGLQAAAIPVMNEKPEDARLALIEQAIGKLSDQMRGLVRELRSKPPQPNPPLTPPWLADAPQGGILGTPLGSAEAFVEDEVAAAANRVFGDRDLIKAFVDHTLSAGPRKKPDSGKKG